MYAVYRRNRVDTINMGGCNMRIVAYCRVSTDKMDQLNSLDQQRAFLRSMQRKLEIH